MERDVAYILKTWHASTRPDGVDPSTVPDWQSLVIKKVVNGGVEDETGRVEFIAVAATANGVFTLHELSRFVKEDGCWLYVDGDILEEGNRTGKIARNAPCPCGSGRKFKKCCGP